jgi:hypothetical protein
MRGLLIPLNDWRLPEGFRMVAIDSADHLQADLWNESVKKTTSTISLRSFLGNGSKKNHIFLLGLGTD